MACDCFDKVNKGMEEKGLWCRLSTNLLGPVHHTMVETYDIVKRPRGEGLISIFATYCPFCGTKYEPIEEPRGHGMNLLKLANDKRKLLTDMEAGYMYCAPLTQATLRADIAALELGQKAVEALQLRAKCVNGYLPVDQTMYDEFKAAADAVLAEAEAE